MLLSAEDLTQAISWIHSKQDFSIVAQGADTNNLAVAHITSQPYGNLTEYHMDFSSSKATNYTHSYDSSDAVHFLMKYFVESHEKWANVQLMWPFTTHKPENK